jgi:hypothetical protein
MRRLSTPSSGPARISATTLIACVALALSGVAVGLVLGRWTAATIQPDERDSAAVSAQTDLAPVLIQVQRSTDAVLQALREGRDLEAPREPSRESATARADVLQRLTTAVEKLNGILERGGVNAGRSQASTEVTKGPGYPSLDALWQKIDSMAAGEDPDKWSEINTEMTRAHLLWTNEDLVQRYGVSSSVSTGNSIILTYQRWSVDSGRPRDLCFMLNDGLILKVFAQ